MAIQDYETDGDDLAEEALSRMERGVREHEEIDHQGIIEDVF